MGETNETLLSNEQNIGELEVMDETNETETLLETLYRKNKKAIKLAIL